MLSLGRVRHVRSVNQLNTKGVKSLSLTISDNMAVKISRRIILTIESEIAVITGSRALSPQHAADIAKVSRGTVMNAIKSGDLTATRNNRNQWQIDSDDLTRWMENRDKSDSGKTVAMMMGGGGNDSAKHAAAMSELTAENKVLAARLEAAHEALADSKGQIERLKSEVDQEREDRRKMQESILDSRKGFWSRITGR